MNNQNSRSYRKIFLVQAFICDVTLILRSYSNICTWDFSLGSPTPRASDDSQACGSICGSFGKSNHPRDVIVRTKDDST